MGELGRDVSLSGGSGTEMDGRVIQMSHAISVLKDKNGIPLLLQTPVFGAELGRTWGYPFCCSRTKAPRSLMGPFLTKYPDLVEIVSHGMNHLPHLAKKWDGGFQGHPVFIPCNPR